LFNEVGFPKVIFTKANLRKEAGEAVPGWVVWAEKSGKEEAAS
jgi:hypothetical protein